MDKDLITVTVRLSEMEVAMLDDLRTEGGIVFGRAHKMTVLIREAWDRRGAAGKTVESDEPDEQESENAHLHRLVDTFTKMGSGNVEVTMRVALHGGGWLEYHPPKPKSSTYPYGPITSLSGVER